MAFTPERARVHRMRRITAAHLALWGVDKSAADNVVLAVSELVTNGILHGCGDISLKVLYADDEVRVEVTDGNPEPARLSAAGDEDVSGRGLLLIRCFARDWGVSADGLTTWATFAAVRKQ
ncbi:ATP-binding protein [Streptomyces sp. H39-S7]|uniref:ATP-binding protein n=1 Tax=Streptomyces sp. H39-S7 TaxID=3004357 RepID=UPI0022AE9F3D|nr:ATP-binding protein [Streptomyces sp. H39-S7]MCZ4118112.1 ATP-binding protein [Streptomyces sp. H39-S7]